MTQFFQFVGGFVVCGFACAVIGYFVIRFWFRSKILKPLAEAAQNAGAFEMTPDMELSRIEAVWRDPSEVGRIDSELQSLGYEKVGDFETRSMPVLLRAYHHDDHSFAVVYEHTAAERPWMDFWRAFENGNQLTVTNAPAGSEIESPPWSTKIWMKNASPSKLRSEFVNLSNQSPVKPHAPEDFEDEFCGAYNRWMRWRAATGGVRRSEILAQDPDISPEELEMAESVFEAQNERLKRQIERRDGNTDDAPPNQD